MQETEDLRLDPEIASKGVAALLIDPAKGKYFVLEVRAFAELSPGSVTCSRSATLGPTGCTPAPFMNENAIEAIIMRQACLSSMFRICDQQEDGRIVAQLMITFEWSDW